MLLQVTRVSLRSCNNLSKASPVLSSVFNFTNASKPNKTESGFFNQTRNKSCIQSRNFRDRSVKKPAPWPYKEKKYTLLHGFIDNTMDRFDDNSRIIVIDGNIGAGKTELAKTLAEELEMVYMPEVKPEAVYINEYGFDLRSLDHMFPETLKTCDLQRFYADPHNFAVTKMQFNMYRLRFEQYVDSLAHLLSTGQGIILERSIYSDFVFVETMLKMGYLNKSAKIYYDAMKKNTILDVLKPHMMIYLDVPVDVCLQRIQKRNLPQEKNSKVLTKQYLQEIENQYKQHYLKDMSQYSELLIFDWSNFGDIDAVIDDVEKVDFDNYDKYDLKLREWRESDKWHWNGLRRYFTTDKHIVLSQLNIPLMDCKELLLSGDDNVLLEKTLDQIPEYSYRKGFNIDMGEEGTLFKSKSNYWDDQKLRFY